MKELAINLPELPYAVEEAMNRLSFAEMIQRRS